MPGISKTVVSLQPGKMEEVSKFLDAQSGAVTELDGMIGFAVAVTGEDEITLIGLYESSQNARYAWSPRRYVGRLNGPGPRVRP